MKVIILLLTFSVSIFCCESITDKIIKIGKPILNIAWDKNDCIKVATESDYSLWEFDTGDKIHQVALEPSSKNEKIEGVFFHDRMDTINIIEKSGMYSSFQLNGIEDLKLDFRFRPSLNIPPTGPVAPVYRFNEDLIMPCYQTPNSHDNRIALMHNLEVKESIRWVMPNTIYCSSIFEQILSSKNIAVAGSSGDVLLPIPKNTAVAGCSDGSVLLLDLTYNSMTEQQKFSLHSDVVLDAKLNLTESCLASVGSDNRIILTDIKSKQCLANIKIDSDTPIKKAQLIWKNDSKLLVLVADKLYRINLAQSPVNVSHVILPEISTVLAFNAKKKIVAIASAATQGKIFIYKTLSYVLIDANNEEKSTTADNRCVII